MTRAQRIGALGLAAVVAVVAVVVLGTDRDDSPPERQPPVEAQESGSAESASRRPEASPAPAYTTIRIRDGEPVGGVKRISLEQNEMARLEVRSDQPTEVHIHGYDRYLDVPPGEPARARFRADLEGIFEIEDHDSGAQLAQLRVNP